MRKWFVILACFLSAGSTLAKDTVDLSKPPYWMPNYDELTHLKTDQLDFYIRGFEKIAKDIPALKDLKKTQLLEATQWAEGWQSIQKKLYRTCLEDRAYEATCKKAADLRIEMFMLKANKKAENLEAEKSAPESVPSTQ